MANGKFLIGKPAGGVTTVTMTDGASNTNLVLPESGTVATQAYADSKTTLAQVQAEISTGSNLITSPTGAIGYGTGVGGTVAQLTSKSTTVTLNKPTGRISTASDALAAGASVNFTLNNNLLQIGDILILTTAGNLAYSLICRYVTTNVAVISITNTTGVSQSQAIPIQFCIIKGVNA